MTPQDKQVVGKLPDERKGLTDKFWDVGNPAKVIERCHLALPAEDARKLHGEIIQLMNQRFLLTTFAITLFAVLVAAVAFKAPVPADTKDLPRQFIVPVVHQATTAYLLILIFISYHANCLRRHMRVFNVYLRVRRASVWERDWFLYRRQQKQKAANKSCMRRFVEGMLKWLFPGEKGTYDILGHDIILLGLGLLAVGLSFANGGNGWTWLPAGLFVLLFGLAMWFRRVAELTESEAEKAWTELLLRGGEASENDPKQRQQ
jgi:hypothetical protein